MAAMSEHAYRVALTREDGQWLAEIPELRGAHTYARSLPTLVQSVREAIVLAADLPDEAVPDLAIEYDWLGCDTDLDVTS
jgi:predicted RNase H-like HicB family nuclease